MERYAFLKDGKYFIKSESLAVSPEGFEGDAAERLWRFEEMKKSLEEQNQALSASLARLRSAGKEKTATFREKMGNKLIITSLLSRLELFGL